MVDNGHERLNPEFLIYLCTGLGSLTSIIFSCHRLVFKAEPLKKVQTDFHPREPHGKVRLLDYARRKSHRLGIAMRKIPLFLLKI